VDISNQKQITILINYCLLDGISIVTDHGLSSDCNNA